MTDAEIKAIAETLASLEPDRGNRYATRTVQTKGEAAHEQWRRTCNTLATTILPDGRPSDPARVAFLAACHCPQWKVGEP